MSANPPDSLLLRKGARTTAGVPEEVRHWLATGMLETVNLTEWLVIDQAALAGAVLPRLGFAEVMPGIAAAFALPENAALTAPKRSALIVAVLRECLSEKSARERQAACEALAAERSDVVRAWACDLTGGDPALTLRQKLTRLRPLAADPNMSVRESVWMAVRESVAADLPQALALLHPWTADADFRVRRFASEVTRPRGVWCRHIQSLKADPSPALPLLEPLRADPEKYVRDSVANWLNDASKSRPEIVTALCERWERESPGRETAYIVRRALRTLRKGEA